MAWPTISFPGQTQFGPTAASINLPSSPGMNFANPAKSYNSAYQNASSINQQLYNNINAGYAKMLQQAQAANQGLLSGYQGLQSSVMQRLAGKNRANLQDIADKYASLGGQMSQQMIDRGLGNTTVQQSVMRGLAQDRTKEFTRSRGEYSQLLANAQSQLGLAGLSAQERGNAMLSGIQGRTLDWMNSVMAPYPDAGMYASLASQLAANRLPGGLPGMPGPARGGGPVGGYAPPMSSSGMDATGLTYGGYNMLDAGGGGYASGLGGGYSPVSADMSSSGFYNPYSENFFGGANLSGADVGSGGYFNPYSENFGGG